VSSICLVAEPIDQFPSSVFLVAKMSFKEDNKEFQHHDQKEKLYAFAERDQAEALRRVFSRLCNFRLKVKPLRALRPTTKAWKKTERILSMPAGTPILGDFSRDTIVKENFELKSKLEKIKAKLAEVDKNCQVISTPDLLAAYKFLGLKIKEAEIQQIVWEVDDDCDGCVGWEEFEAMYQRNLFDVTGYEPYQLYTLVEFMIFDRDNSGQVTLDEMLEALYRRNGKKKVEIEMKKLFGDDFATTRGDTVLSLQEYVLISHLSRRSRKR